MSDLDVDRHLRAKIADLTAECKELRATLAQHTPAPQADAPKQTFTRAEVMAAIAAERHACSIAVWMALQDALAPDADDRGLDGWMREAEQRIKNRAANDPEAVQADALDATQRVPLTADELADRCEAWLQSSEGHSVSNTVDAYEAGWRECEAFFGIGAPQAQADTQQPKE